MGQIVAMHDDAELLEQVTRDVMESRRARTLRVAPDASGRIEPEAPASDSSHAS
jgi:hypothetical protein